MRRTFITLALTAAAFTTPAVAIEARASYVLTLGGINFATAAITLTEDGSRYAIDLAADVIGLGNLMTSGRASISSGGTVSGDQLRPEGFGLETVTGGESFRTTVEYASGDVTAFVVDPPLPSDYGRVPIERSHLRGVTDMMSAFLIRSPALDAGVCDHEARVFTGVERFDVAMRFSGEDVATSQRTGYQGPVVLCTVRYVPISGHYTDSAIIQGLAGNDRILIWYAPLGATGYFIPYRVLLSTSMGDLSMVLTALRG